MQYRRLPGTDLEVSVVGFDGFTVGSNWRAGMEEKKRIRLLEEALHMGINFFDMADVYGQGYGEELLSKAFKQNRHDVIIGTKFGYALHDVQSLLNPDRPAQRFDKEYVRYSCEWSLRRLKTDYIDLYQIHDPPSDSADIAELFFLLDDLVDEGKIRYYGAAFTQDIDAAIDGIELLNGTNAVTLQIPLTISDCQRNNKIMSLANDRGIGLIGRLSNPIAKSLLADDYRDTDSSGRNVDAGRETVDLESKEMASISQKSIYDQFEITRTQFEINVHLSRLSILSVLGNITTTAELLEHIDALDTKTITLEEIDVLKKLLLGEFRID